MNQIKGRDFFKNHHSSLKKAVSGLSTEVLFMLTTSLVSSAQLIEAELRRRISSDMIVELESLKSLTLEFFLSGGYKDSDNAFRRFIWRSFLSEFLSGSELAEVVIAASRSSDYRVEEVCEEAFERLLQHDDIEDALVKVTEQSRRLRKKAFDELLKREPGKEHLLRCLKLEDLRVKSFDLLVRLQLLDKTDLERLQGTSGLAVRVRRLLKEFG